MNSPSSIKPMPSLYEGLRAMRNVGFPLTCEVCGESYGNLENYVARTKVSLAGPGLCAVRVRVAEAGESSRVGLMRTCTCGAMLRVLCEDRRDETPAGEQRRAIFGRLLHNLMSTGLSRSAARQRLLDALRSTGDAQAMAALLR